MELFHDKSGKFASLKSKAYWAYHWFFVRLLWAGFAVIAFTVYFYPVEEKPVGGTLTLIEVVQAEEVVREIPILEKIAECESGNQHFGKSGQVILNANSNDTVDAGKFQINTVWFAKATELGLDVMTEEGNEKMARYIFENYGTSPWYASQKCWG